MEDYAKELVDTFCWAAIRRCQSAAVSIESTMWKRLTIDGKPHPHIVYARQR